MIWQECQGPQQIKPISGVLHRLVESQEQIATLGYVDTLEEQAMLEQMLESVKPANPEGNATYHYLLTTPFRYPPLKWGSRFGKVHEPSLFYGGKEIEVTLAESAYYRFVFWNSMDGKPVKERIRTEHTLFSAPYRTKSGVQLQAEPFNHAKEALTDPSDYQACQQLGAAMRSSEVEAFEYFSARSPQSGVCVGLFKISAFRQKQPQSMSPWLCELSANEVLFKQLGSNQVTAFSLQHYLVNGQFPLPA